MTAPSDRWRWKLREPQNPDCKYISRYVKLRSSGADSARVLSDEAVKRAQLQDDARSALFAAMVVDYNHPIQASGCDMPQMSWPAEFPPLEGPLHDYEPPGYIELKIDNSQGSEPQVVHLIVEVGDNDPRVGRIDPLQPNQSRCPSQPSALQSVQELEREPEPEPELKPGPPRSDEERQLPSSYWARLREARQAGAWRPEPEPVPAVTFAVTAHSLATTTGAALARGLSAATNVVSEDAPGRSHVASARTVWNLMELQQADVGAYCSASTAVFCFKDQSVVDGPRVRKYIVSCTSIEICAATSNDDSDSGDRWVPIAPDGPGADLFRYFDSRHDVACDHAGHCFENVYDLDNPEINPWTGQTSHFPGSRGGRLLRLDQDFWKVTFPLLIPGTRSRLSICAEFEQSIDGHGASGPRSDENTTVKTMTGSALMRRAMAAFKEPDALVCTTKQASDVSSISVIQFPKELSNADQRGYGDVPQVNQRDAERIKVWQANLAAGTYWVVVDNYKNSPYKLTVSITLESVSPAKRSTMQVVVDPGKAPQFEIDLNRPAHIVVETRFKQEWSIRQWIQNDNMKYRLAVKMQATIVDVRTSVTKRVVEDDHMSIKNIEEKRASSLAKRRQEVFEARMVTAYFTASAHQNKTITCASSSAFKSDADKREEMKLVVEAKFRARSGMEDLRKYLDNLRSEKVMREFRKDATGIETPAGRMHMVFLGNAGTGKTTAAKLAKDFLYAHAIIAEDKIVSVMAKDLTTIYSTGHGERAAQVMNEAIGGVLFIDEAYQLAGEEHGGSKESQQVVTVLLQFLEDHERPDKDGHSTVVILGGYEREMQSLWRSNQGLQSRFSDGGRIIFPDFPLCTLTEIAVKMLASKHVYMQGDQFHPDKGHYIPSAVLPNMWEYVHRYRAMFADRVDPDWHPKSADETQRRADAPTCLDVDCFVCNNGPHKTTPKCTNQSCRLCTPERDLDPRQEWGNARSIGNMVDQILRNRDLRLQFTLEEDGADAAFGREPSEKNKTDNSGTSSNRAPDVAWIRSNGILCDDVLAVVDDEFEYNREKPDIMRRRLESKAWPLQLPGYSPTDGGQTRAQLDAKMQHEFSHVWRRALEEHGNFDIESQYFAWTDEARLKDKMSHAYDSDQWPLKDQYELALRQDPQAPFSVCVTTYWDACASNFEFLFSEEKHKDALDMAKRQKSKGKTIKTEGRNTLAGRIEDVLRSPDKRGAAPPATATRQRQHDSNLERTRIRSRNRDRERLHVLESADLQREKERVAKLEQETNAKALSRDAPRGLLLLSVSALLYVMYYHSLALILPLVLPLAIPLAFVASLIFALYWFFPALFWALFRCVAKLLAVVWRVVVFFWRNPTVLFFLLLLYFFIRGLQQHNLLPPASELWRRAVQHFRCPGDSLDIQLRQPHGQLVDAKVRCLVRDGAPALVHAASVALIDPSGPATSKVLEIWELDRCNRCAADQCSRIHQLPIESGSRWFEHGQNHVQNGDCFEVVFEGRALQPMRFTPVTVLVVIYEQIVQLLQALFEIVCTARAFEFLEASQMLATVWNDCASVLRSLPLKWKGCGYMIMEWLNIVGELSSQQQCRQSTALLSLVSLFSLGCAFWVIASLSKRSRARLGLLLALGTLCYGLSLVPPDLQLARSPMQEKLFTALQRFSSNNSSIAFNRAQLVEIVEATAASGSNSSLLMDPDFAGAWIELDDNSDGHVTAAELAAQLGEWSTSTPLPEPSPREQVRTHTNPDSMEKVLQLLSDIQHRLAAVEHARDQLCGTTANEWRA
eukprot:SAG31_NODE_1307_length_8887_cov_3.767183_3_plen_1778_part_00